MQLERWKRQLLCAYNRYAARVAAKSAFKRVE